MSEPLIQMPRPQGVVLITRTGMRLPVGVKMVQVLEDHEGPMTVWAPVIEGDIRALISDIVAIDVDFMPNRTALALPEEEGFGWVQGRQPGP